MSWSRGIEADERSVNGLDHSSSSRRTMRAVVCDLNAPRDSRVVICDFSLPWIVRGFGLSFTFDSLIEVLKLYPCLVD